MADKIFPEGIRFFIPDKKPDFVIGNLSIELDKFGQWLKDNPQHKENKMNFNVLMSKKGNPYVELNTYKKEDKNTF